MILRKLLFISTLAIFANSGKASPIPEQMSFEVIIDTDGAIDDLRAISMLLSRPEVIIKAILLSDGTLPPAESYARIMALLQTFKADSIPVGTGPSLEGINPQWREFNRRISFPVISSAQPDFIEAGKLLNKVLIESEEHITLLCLGPLTNIKLALEADSRLAAKMDRIIWYRGNGKMPGSDFNYYSDTASAKMVMNSGISMTLLTNLHYGNDIFDADMVHKCVNSNTQLASFLIDVHTQPDVFQLVSERHFSWYDELVPLYLLNAELFDMDISSSSVKHRYNRGYNAAALREVLSDMIKGTYARDHNVVFLEFPDDPALYTYDVREIMDSAIMLYGHEEWKANVLTDEFHGHLGVFSIVGAKMGTKAKELFGVQNDQLQVITYAGQTPPYSCLTDGIQVSTGATLGMGTIHLAGDSPAAPMAVFTFNGKSIKISLKTEYLNQVDNDINEGIVKFGLADDGYWKLVRRNALRYWVEWDRNEIFNIEEIN